MSLICPVCGASYNVPASALGAEGRMVSCAKCKHKWHASAADIEPPAPVIEKPLLPSEPPAEKPKPKFDVPPDIKQLQIIPAPEIKKDASEERQIRLKAANLTPVVAVKPESVFMVMFKQFFPIASLVFFSLLAAALIIARSPITQRAPGMLAFYNLIGVSALPPGGGITIVNVRDESHFGQLDNALILSGQLINHTPMELKVPLFKLIFTNPEGQNKTFMARGPVEKISGAQEVPFRIERPGFAQEGWSVKITFGDGSEGPDTGKPDQTVAPNKPIGGDKK